MSNKDADTIGGEPERPDTFNDIIIKAGGSVNWRLWILMFIVFIILMTDSFEEHILSRFSGAVTDGGRTLVGHGITGLFLVLACIIMDAALHFV